MRIVERPNEWVEVVLHGDRPPLARMRQWTSGLLADVAEDRLTDVLLVANALLSNAFRHADSPRRYRVLRPRASGVVRIEVEDSSPGRLPVLGRFGSVLHPEGRGLLLVNRLAALWGVVPQATRKTVWAEVTT
ncbi:ATP-binding protein [Saccharothrix coeruleofusca]|uniref:ATPase n=1 Tax=Saccharothrix coeruleofusca TaxID=33919 RepID=A0A918EI17_9PSEU|nr:ATP-binding protein [Saccharothrix coeruleofusca]GGP82151.1 ATPase [Saccharothrix coeruleofusca]